jgi:hypothetical protein
VDKYSRDRYNYNMARMRFVIRILRDRRYQNVQYVPIFHGSNDDPNAFQCYVISVLPILS